MTLRITLLALATGLFSLIWIHDRQSPKSPILETARIAAEQGVSDQTSVQLPDSAVTERVEEVPVWTRRNPRMLETVSVFQSLIRRQLRELSERSYLGMSQIAESAHQFNGWTTKPTNSRPAESAKFASSSPTDSEDRKFPLPEAIPPGEYRVVSQTGIVVPLTLTLADLQAQNRFITQDVYRSESGNMRWHFIRVQPESEPVAPAIAERREPDSIRQQAGEIVLETARSILSRTAQMIKSRNDAERTARSLWKSPLLRFSSRDIEGDATRR